MGNVWVTGKISKLSGDGKKVTGMFIPVSGRYEDTKVWVDCSLLNEVDIGVVKGAYKAQSDVRVKCVVRWKKYDDDKFALQLVAVRVDAKGGE